MKINEVGVRCPVTISPLASTDEAVRLMWELDVRHLLAVDRQGLVGIVTDADLLESVGMLTCAERRSIGPSMSLEEIIVADIMDAECPCAHLDDDVNEAAGRMVLAQRTALPVVEGSQLMGVLADMDLLELFAGVCWLDRSSPHGEPVSHYASLVHKTVGPFDTLATACTKLSQGRIRHLPVVDGDRFVGLISDGDLRRAIGQHASGWQALPVAEFMLTGTQTLRPKDSLLCAAEVMCMERLTALPIVTRDGALSGIITGSDLLRAFAGEPAHV